MKLKLVLIGIVFLSVITSCEKKSSASSDNVITELTTLPSKEEIVKIAEEAYTFGIPYVFEYRTMYMQAIDPKSSSYVGFGKFLHYGATTDKDKDVMTPNRDTPYSWVWFDLRAEPWVLSVPKMDANEKRYYSFMINDLAGFVVDNVSSLNDGYEGGDYLIAPIDWDGEVPAGIKRVIKGETQFMVALVRTELLGNKDAENVKKIQEQYKVQPLSSYSGTIAPAPAPEIDYYKFVDGKTDLDIDFYDCLSFLLKFNIPNEIDKPILDRMAKIGITSGNDWLALANKYPELKEGAKQGMQNVISKLDEVSKKPLVKGETDLIPFDNRSVMKDNYTNRAIGAYLGLFGNTQKEAIYNNLGSDTNNVPLDASTGKYTLTITKDNIPDVQFFWSLTMYNAKDRFLVANPIDRFSIGSRTEGLKYNTDGSLTIYVQKDNPGKGKESNWLPAPDGPFYSIMRLYGPGENVLNNTFKQPQFVKVN